MARAQVLKSFTLKFQQSNKCLWGNKRGRTKRRTTKELQELDPLGSPHLEERWIGGNVDLGLLLQSTKNQQVWVEGLGDRQAFQGQQWWERERKTCLHRLKKGRGIYSPSRKLAVGAFSVSPGSTGRRPVVPAEASQPWSTQHLGCGRQKIAGQYYRARPGSTGKLPPPTSVQLQKMSSSFSENPGSTGRAQYMMGGTTAPRPVVPA